MGQSVLGRIGFCRFDIRKMTLCYSFPTTGTLLPSQPRKQGRSFTTITLVIHDRKEVWPYLPALSLSPHTLSECSNHCFLLRIQDSDIVSQLLMGFDDSNSTLLMKILSLYGIDVCALVTRNSATMLGKVQGSWVIIREEDTNV